MEKKKRGAGQLGSEAPRQSGPVGEKIPGRNGFVPIHALAEAIIRDVNRKRGR